MVEDFNDDVVMELCKFSNELKVLNPSKFASIGTTFGIREGFSVGLTTARANGNNVRLQL